MSPWIQHVKAYQTKHRCSYKEAMTKSKASYRKTMSGKGVLEDGTVLLAPKLFDAAGKALDETVGQAGPLGKAAMAGYHAVTGKAMSDLNAYSENKARREKFNSAEEVAKRNAAYAKLHKFDLRDAKTSSDLLRKLQEVQNDLNQGKIDRNLYNKLATMYKNALKVLYEQEYKRGNFSMTKYNSYLRKLK